MYEINKLTADVNVDEYIEHYVDIPKFSKLCEECEHYGKNWGCPPFDFDPMDVWTSYEKFKIIAFKITFDEDDLNQTYNEKQLELLIKRIERMKLKFMNEIYALEDDNSVGLFLGVCNLCMRCTKELGMPCKMPFKLRYSPESLGADIDSTIGDLFGLKILYAENGKLPEYLIFVGGLLFDKK